jgi:predicted histone-like DNA-binding protein
MKYKLMWRVNPQNRNQRRLYAVPVNDGTITKADLAREIVALSSLSRGDVSNVIECILEVIPKYLLMGKSVSLGEIGTFHVSFSSEGVDSKAEFNVGMIDGKKILFTPGSELKKQLQNIHFEFTGETGE